MDLKIRSVIFIFSPKSSVSHYGKLLASSVISLRSISFYYTAISCKASDLLKRSRKEKNSLKLLGYEVVFTNIFEFSDSLLGLLTWNLQPSKEQEKKKKSCFIITTCGPFIELYVRHVREIILILTIRLQVVLYFHF